MGLRAIISQELHAMACYRDEATEEPVLTESDCPLISGLANIA